MKIYHLDEARAAVLEIVRRELEVTQSLERCTVIEDIFGQFRVIGWVTGTESQDDIRSRLVLRLDLLRPFWTGDIWLASHGESNRLYDLAWAEGRPVDGSDVLRLTSRHRSRGGWLQPLVSPPWTAEGPQSGPPVVVFYSFKGGVGRSTALASFALQRTRAGERVVVLDFDLDAPGIGPLLAADASWGVVDYWLERPFCEAPLSDYYQAWPDTTVTGSGELIVVPAGRLDEHYVAKLARLDFEPETHEKHPNAIVSLLEEIRGLKPHWILLDSRTGLSEPGGLLLGGVAHLHVLFGTSSQQSWNGLRLVLERVGAERVRSDCAQLEVLLVQAMIPENLRVASMVREAFSDQALDEFKEHYYAADPDDADEDRYWYVRDAESDDAPHVPVPISYKQELAHFESFREVADLLATDPEYQALGSRIIARYQRGEEESW